ncbi:hypothetical protein HYE67_008947 [Fusarium culmorum]|uniref:Uncharacterized protein n=1 Tax=Fusarium culmorum TaxID=5516 RepID=A0A2T4HAK0_FUSCU|nr:hypothetical protein FCULG_00003655 [Fusarium culmorum]QPC66716.1 hypothetical protein HYE67_008947 [Fusarium culmorum]
MNTKVFVWNLVLNILASDLVGVGKNQGQRAKVLILLRHFYGLIAAKQISQEMRSRVSIKTLDSVQADEADIGFADTVNHPNLVFRGATLRRLSQERKLTLGSGCLVNSSRI